MTYKLIKVFLETHGPSCSSKIKEFLLKTGLSETAARKSLSRRGKGINVFTSISLPKRESFLYLDKQYNTPDFWGNLISTHIDKNSSYGIALSSLILRGSMTPKEHFYAQSGLPKVKKNHLSYEFICQKLIDLDLLKSSNHEVFGSIFNLNPQLGIELEQPQRKEAQVFTENIIIQAVVEWLKKTGIASYKAIKARSYDKSTYFGPYAWDITAPSYLLPLKTFKASKVQSGFVVADVANYRVDSNSIKFFLRKCKGMSSLNSTKPFLPILIASSFTEDAFALGKSEGYLLTTPKIIFGNEIADAFLNLTEMLTNAAAAAISKPENIFTILGSLGKIEGAANNLKGPLFEMMAAYLVNKHDGFSVDIGKKVQDDNGNKAELDVFAVLGKRSIKIIECKAKSPKTLISDKDVSKWIDDRIPLIKRWILAEGRFNNTEITFEYWTTSDYTNEAKAIIKNYNPQKHNATFKAGYDILEYAKSTQEQSIIDGLNEHFFNHPLSKIC